jgi:hypothetical protein
LDEKQSGFRMGRGDWRWSNRWSSMQTPWPIRRRMFKQWWHHRYHNLRVEFSTSWCHKVKWKD